MRKNSPDSPFFHKSIIQNNFGTIDYSDVFSAEVPNPHHYSIDYLAAISFGTSPRWVTGLLAVRNFVVGWFGLKSGNATEIRIPDPTVYYPVGSTVSLFRVESRTDNEIILGESDRHLNFRTGLMLEQADNTTIRLYSSTIVHYNNFFGKFYFFFVKPFHRIIVKNMLTRVVKRII